MLADLTPEEFSALQTALAEAQRAGDASPPGAISYAEIGAWFGTSAHDIRLIELTALEKLRARHADALEDFLTYIHV